MSHIKKKTSIIPDIALHHHFFLSNLLFTFKIVSNSKYAYILLKTVKANKHDYPKARNTILLVTTFGVIPFKRNTFITCK